MSAATADGGMRDLARAVFTAILPALDPARAVRARLRCDQSDLTIDDRRLRRADFDRVRLVAIGKAAAPMAAAAAQVLGGELGGVVVLPHGVAAPALPVSVVHAGHPIPDAGSARAAAAVRATLAGCTERDLVVFLLSGGGSALCEAPLDPAVPAAAVAAFHGALVHSGLDIVAMNTLRKHASAVKGGRLAVLAAPAAQLTLLVSDVPSGRLDAVASGPSLPDSSTTADCRRLLAHGDLATRLPAAHVALLGAPELPETPKPGDPAFRRSSWHCLLDNAAAIAAARERCSALGWLVAIDDTQDDAPVADAAAHLLRALRARKQAHPAQTVALLAGGELSCPVRGGGVGGRNQHFVLHCALQIEGEPITVLSAGTDGIDGNSPAAGAVADGSTCRRARARGLDPRTSLEGYDAYPLFAALGDAVQTGPTGGNVRDLRLLVM